MEGQRASGPAGQRATGQFNGGPPRGAGVCLRGKLRRSLAPVVSRNKGRGMLPALAAALRTFATRAQRQRPLPHSKAVIQGRKQVKTSVWGSHCGLTQPQLAAKYLRHAERVAWELGVVEDLRQFEEAAAAFPNPPRLVAATCVEAATRERHPLLPNGPQPPLHPPHPTRTHPHAAFLSAAT